MSLNSLGLGFIFSAVDTASGVMQTVDKNLKSLSDSSGKSIGDIDGAVKKLGGGLTAMAIGAGGVATAFALAGKAGTFEQALAAVGAVSNATTEELGKLRAAAIEAGKKTQFSPTQAIEGLNELSQAGYDAKESIELLDPVLKLAAGSLGDLSPADAAGLASQALKAFGIDASLAGNAVDQLLQSANAFAVKPRDLALGLGTASSGAQTLNQSLTETVIAFGLVKNVIPGTERAATSVKVAMERLANPKVQQQLKAHHVAVTDAQGGYRQFLDIIKDLVPELNKMTEQQRGDFMMKVFGTEGLSGVNAMLAQFNTGIKGADGQIRKGGEAIDYLRNSFASAKGVAEGFSNKLLDTYEGAQTLLSGSMETLGVLIGEPFKDLLRPVISGVTASVNKVIELLDNMSPGVKRFFAGLWIGASALLVLGGALVLWQPAAMLFSLGMGMVTTALADLAIAAASALLAFWPFILGGLAIAGVVAVMAYAIENNIGGIGDAWSRLSEKFSGVGTFFAATFETVSNYATGFWNAFSSGFSSVMEIISPVFADIGEAFDMVSSAFSDLGKVFSDTTSGPGQGSLSFFRLLGNVLGWIVDILLHVVKYALYFVTVIVEIASAIGSILKPIVQGIIDALSFWIDKIMGVVDTVKGWLGKREDARKPGKKPTAATVGQPLMSSEPMSSEEPVASAALPSGPEGTAEKFRSLMPNVDVGAASASAAAGLMSSPNANQSVDYDRLAASLSKQPIVVNLIADGEKLAGVVARGARTSAARAGGRDHEEI